MSRFWFSKPVLAALNRKGEATNACARITAIVNPGMVMPNCVRVGPRMPLGANA